MEKRSVNVKEPGAQMRANFVKEQCEAKDHMGRWDRIKEGLGVKIEPDVANGPGRRGRRTVREESEWLLWLGKFASRC